MAGRNYPPCFYAHARAEEYAANAAHGRRGESGKKNLPYSIASVRISSLSGLCYQIKPGESMAQNFRTAIG